MSKIRPQAGLLAVLFLLCLVLSAPTLHLPGSHWVPGLDRFRMKLGLDLSGGIDLLYRIKPTGKTSDSSDLAQRASRVLAERIDGLGLANVAIQLQGATSDQIRVLVPAEGGTPAATLKDVLESTNLLTFSEVLDVARSAAELDTSRPDTLAAPAVDQQGAKPAWYLLKRQPILTGDAVEEARVEAGTLGEPEIHFRLSSVGAQAFGTATRTLKGHQVAIVLAGKVYMAPTIEGPIEQDGRIIGRFDLQEARRVVGALKGGALPCELELLTQNTIGPTLGLDTVQKGLTASLWGATAVTLFMVGFYRWSGVLAILALVLNLLLQIILLTFFGATLTLPGIAGFALTVGMAVDSNIIIFERIKEELALGKAARNALAAGYEKAFTTLIDSHFTAILTGLILARFGTGPIRGFAITLIIGLVVNLFTSIWATRVLQEGLTSDRPASISI
jgi:protein-export membrane protein SecD